jgi:hypothetical protein
MSGVVGIYWKKIFFFVKLNFDVDPSLFMWGYVARGGGSMGKGDGVGELHPIALDSLLGLEHCLDIAIPLHEPFAVKVSLFDVLFPARVDALEEGLELCLLLLPGPGLLPRKECRRLRLDAELLLVLHLVGDLL